MTDKSTSCGLFNYRPAWAQRFANQKVYMLLFVVIGIIQSMAFSYLTVVLSTIEKRFGLKSKEATWIYSGNEISQVAFFFALPFVGRVKRRPLFMGLSIMLSALGLFIIAFPHFTGEQSYLTDLNEQVASGDLQPDDQVCNSGKIRIAEGECDGSVHNKDWVSLGIVFLGIFLLGIGVSFYFSFGVPYVDDNTERGNSPFALSVVFSARVIGPTLGYFLGSACLAYYVDPGQVPNGITEGHPRWIGAWWIGFVVIAVLLMLFSPWLTLFPARFESKSETDAQRLDKKGDAQDQPETLKDWLNDYKEVAKRLFSSKVYVLNNISGAAFLFGIIGMALFFPKYIEFHFRQKASVSGSAGGVPKTVSSVIGMLVSGWIIGKYRFKGRALSGWCVFADVCAIVGICCFSLFACPPTYFPSITASSENSIVMTECNQGCGCEGIPYNPVCSQEDGYTNYFSPCHAGCESYEELNGTIIKYTNCKCLQNSPSLPPPNIGSIANFTVQSGTVSIGTCPVDCSTQFYAMIGFLTVFAIIGSTTRIPNMLLSLRSIEMRDKSASITFSVSFLSLFAFLPSPFVYGAILDSTCILWDTTKCGEQTHCLIYDTDAMRNWISFFPSVFVFLGTLADIGVWYYSKDLSIYDEDEDNNGQTEDTEMKEKGFKEVDLS